ncbi:MAG TPA: hypothetical protein PLZ45_10295 [Ferruginibacter sp.]|nr:hypothetical protein [Chitinophagaceae bacterium]HRI25059.1 hypothetical protein [Ferruginibacter sp.]
MIDIPSYRFYRFLSDYILAYTFAVIILFVLFLFLRNRWRNETYNFLYVQNTLLAWINLLTILSNLTELFIAWYGQNTYEWYAFRSGETFSFTRYYTHMALTLLPGLLFFFRRFRTSWLLTIVFVLLQNAGAIGRLFSYNADYLPSSWSYYPVELIKAHVINSVIITGLLVFLYWWANQRRKLPYPSLFLKQHVQ